MNLYADASSDIGGESIGSGLSEQIQPANANTHMVGSLLLPLASVGSLVGGFVSLCFPVYGLSVCSGLVDSVFRKWVGRFVFHWLVIPLRSELHGGCMADGRG